MARADRPVVVLVESNTTGTGEMFVDRLIERGYAVHFFTRAPDKYPFLSAKPLTLHHVDTGDDARLLRLACDLGAPVAGVWSASEYAIGAASRLAQQLGLPCLAHDAIAACRDKAYQRLLLNSSGLSPVPYRVVADAKQALAAADDIGFPLVVKPVSGSGSVGVRVYRTRAAMRRDVARQLADIPDGRYLVESHIAGPQYSVELFDGEVIGLTRQYYGPPPACIAVGHDFPAMLDTAATRALADLARAAAALFGLARGPVHIEARLGAEGGGRIIEINPRLAGGYIPELIRLATGIDLIAWCIDFCTGSARRPGPPRQHHAAIGFFLRGQHDPARIAAPAPDCAVTLYPPRTDVDGGSRQGDFRDRFGHVVAVADQAGLARERVDRFLHGLSI